LRGLLDARWYRDPITGTASELLHDLTRRMPQNITRSAGWPKTPHALSCLLRRLAPQSRAIGIDVTFERHKSARLIRVRALDDDDEFKDTLRADSETLVRLGG
jgi:hypothetical protein